MVKPRLDSDLHNEILSRGSFSMNGCVVVSFPFTHLPGVFPIRPQPPFHLLFHLVSVRIVKLWAHLPVRCSWGLGPLDDASSPVFCPVRDAPPTESRSPCPQQDPCALYPVPESLQPSALSSPRKGSLGSIPDLQTRLGPELAPCP